MTLARVTPRSTVRSNSSVRMPQSFLWRQLRQSYRWEHTVTAQRRWVIKSSAHRGMGVSVVRSDDILRAEQGEGELELRKALRRHDTILQIVS